MNIFGIDFSILGIYTYMYLSVFQSYQGPTSYIL